MKLRHIVITIILISGVNCNAQFKMIEIGVNGLTCSQCSRSVEMSIRKLDFVSDVQMDLEHTEGKISLKKDEHVSIEKVAKAIIESGFSVRYIKARFDFTYVSITDHCFQYDGKTYQFIHSNESSLTGEKYIQFLGRSFLPKKEYKTLKKDLKGTCEPKSEILFLKLL